MRFNKTALFLILFPILLSSLPIHAHTLERLFEIVSRDAADDVRAYLDSASEDDQFDLLNTALNGQTVLHYAVVVLGKRYETGDGEYVAANSHNNMFFVLRLLGAGPWEDAQQHTPTSLATAMGFKRAAESLESPLDPQKLPCDEEEEDPNTSCQFEMDE